MKIEQLDAPYEHDHVDDENIGLSDLYHNSDTGFDMELNKDLTAATRPKIETGPIRQQRQHQVSHKKIGDIMNRAVDAGKPRIPEMQPVIAEVPVKTEDYKTTIEKAKAIAADNDMNTIPESGLMSLNELQDYLSTANDPGELQANLETRQVALAEYQAVYAKQMNKENLRGREIKKLMDEQAQAVILIELRLKDLMKSSPIGNVVDKPIDRPAIMLKPEKKGFWARAKGFFGFGSKK